VEMWFNPRCSKCRIAKEALDDAGLTYDLRYYLEQPPSAAELVDVQGRLGLAPWDICRTADAPKIGITLPAARDAAHRDEWVALLVSHPELIQRPIIVTDDGTAYVTRDPAALETAIEHARPAR
jgi:arsenate reductase